MKWYLLCDNTSLLAKQLCKWPPLLDFPKRSPVLEKGNPCVMHRYFVFVATHSMNSRRSNPGVFQNDSIPSFMNVNKTNKQCHNKTGVIRVWSQQDSMTSRHISDYKAVLIYNNNNNNNNNRVHRSFLGT